MNTASILFGSVGLSTNRIIKTTVNVECLFGLAREAVKRAGDAIRMNHADSIRILGTSSCVVQGKMLHTVLLRYKGAQENKEIIFGRELRLERLSPPSCGASRGLN